MNDRLSKDPAYRRLPTGRRSLLRPHFSCWLASDHLLLVEVVGYSERYSRFDLRDIQSVVLHASRARAMVAWIASAALVPALGLLAFLLPTADGLQPGHFLVALLAFIPLSALAWAAWCGPLCSIRISTAVQVARLPALHNLTRAREFARELREAALAQAATPTVPSSASPT